MIKFNTKNICTICTIVSFPCPLEYDDLRITNIAFDDTTTVHHSFRNASVLLPRMPWMFTLFGCCWTEGQRKASPSFLWRRKTTCTGPMVTLNSLSLWKTDTLWEGRITQLDFTRLFMSCYFQTCLSRDVSCAAQCVIRLSCLAHPEWTWYWFRFLSGCDLFFPHRSCDKLTLPLGHKGNEMWFLELP